MRQDLGIDFIPLRKDHAAPSAATTAVMPLGLSGLQLILAYEWLVSALDKIGNANFGRQLVTTLRGSAQGGPYGWYGALLRDVILPNHTIFAFLTQAGELAIGLTLALATTLWLVRPGARWAVYGAGAAAAALLGSIFLSVNYFLQTGYPIPWINPNNSFVPGVDINTLVALLSLLLLAVNVRLICRWLLRPSQTLA